MITDRRARAAKGKVKASSSFTNPRRLMLRKARNFYETLGIKPTAPQRDVLSSVRRLRLCVHPDKVRQTPITQAIWELLELVNNIMKEPFARGSYDASLRTGGLPPHGCIETDIPFFKKKFGVD